MKSYRVDFDGIKTGPGRDVKCVSDQQTIRRCFGRFEATDFFAVGRDCDYGTLISAVDIAVGVDRHAVAADVGESSFVGDLAGAGDVVGDNFSVTEVCDVQRFSVGRKGQTVRLFQIVGDTREFSATVDVIQPFNFHLHVITVSVARIGEKHSAQPVQHQVVGAVESFAVILFGQHLDLAIEQAGDVPLDLHTKSTRRWESRTVRWRDLSGCETRWSYRFSDRTHGSSGWEYH